MIEGDIQSCFEGITFDVLYPLVSRYVADRGFEALVRKFYKAGYMVGGYRKVSKGILQGRPLRPMLMNIVLNELDGFIEEVMRDVKANYRAPRRNPEYTRLMRRDTKKREEQIREDRQKVVKKRIPSLVYDETRTLVKYVRYADDFLVGVSGSRKYCLELKKEIGNFLQDRLALTLSLEKTKITHITRGRAEFLGAEIHKTPRQKLPYRDGKIRTSRILISVPVTKVIEKLIEKGIGQKNKKGA